MYSYPTNYQSVAIAFDIDGVIVDSEPLHFEVMRDCLPGLEKVPPESLIGLSLQETLNKVETGCSDTGFLEAAIVELYCQRINTHFLRPFIVELITSLLQANCPIGFVSTAPRLICRANLQVLEIPNVLACPLISGEDLAKNKPHPDPYLEIARLLDTAPTSMIAVEDTDLGICAARSAGIKMVYAWPHGLSASQGYSDAFKVIKELSEIPFFSPFLSDLQEKI